MSHSKQEGELSIRNKCYVLICLTIALLGVALFRIKFPALRGALSDTLFIAMIFVTFINVFRRKK